MSAANNPADVPVPKVLALLGLQTAAFVVIGWSIWVATGRGASSFVSFELWEVGYGFALAGVLIAIALGLERHNPEWSDRLVRLQARNYPFLKHGLEIPAIVFLSICAGLGEEALFRGGIQTALGDYIPAPLAIVLASALFALIHFAQPIISALIFAIGCIFGAVYLATGSLLSVIIAHAVYDVYAVWALQEAMHRLQLFAEPPANAPTPEEAP